MATSQLTTIQERYITETLESWEKKVVNATNSSGSDKVQRGGHGGVTLDEKTTQTTIGKRGSCKQASANGVSSKQQSAIGGHVKVSNITPPSRSKHRELAWLGDTLTKKIITAIAMRYNKKGIIRATGAKEGTVKNRLKQLESHGYIKPHKESVGGTEVVIYSMTPKGGHALIHNESSSETGVQSQKSAHAGGFKYDESHGNTFKFKLLGNGAQVIAQLPEGVGCKYKMNNWEGRVFESEDCSWFIRTTTQNIIVYVNQDLGKDTPQDLMLKYADRAKETALLFSERYKVPMASIPKWYRDPHFTIKDNQLSQMVQDALGSADTQNFGMDKSRSNGDFEAKKTDAAIGLAFTISDMPQVAERMEGGLKALSDNLTTKFKELNITLALMQENQTLRTENQVKNEKIKDLVTKAEEQGILIEKFTQKFEEIQKQFEDFKKKIEYERAGMESSPLDSTTKSVLYG